MVLLNALLQKSRRESEGEAEDRVSCGGSRARHHSTPSANASSPENVVPTFHYRRPQHQANQTAGNALIMDVSTETQNASSTGPLVTPPSKSVFMEEASTAYVDVSVVFECDAHSIVQFLLKIHLELVCDFANIRLNSATLAMLAYIIV